eukprot:gene12820-15044_t
MKLALGRELDYMVTKHYDMHPDAAVRPRLASIYFGGGTPSLARIDTLQYIVDKASKIFGITSPSEQLEITLEVNPDRMDIDLLSDFKKHVNVNRVSLGVQALNDSDLKFLGRTHNAKDAKDAIRRCNSLFDKKTGVLRSKRQ